MTTETDVRAKVDAMPVTLGHVETTGADWLGLTMGVPTAFEVRVGEWNCIGYPTYAAWVRADAMSRGWSWADGIVLSPIGQQQIDLGRLSWGRVVAGLWATPR